MTIPVWVLLAFALWTLITLTVTVGVYRWRRILTGRTPISEFRYDRVAEHEDWYRRGMRAHGNCVENLPVYGAIVLILSIAGLDSRLLDALALALIVARIGQTLTHVSFVETDLTVSIRFTFFAIQTAVMIWMSLIVILALA